MPENKQESPAENGQESPDEMSAEEQAAFNKIMGEIEGGDDSSATDGAAESAATEPASESEEDFSAELEKVAQEADASGDETADEAAGASDADALDEDQQKAFESIMAQIAGGDADGTGSSSGDADPNRGSVAEDDFSAELEKVVQEADASGDEVAEETTEAADVDALNEDALDEDQQKAFESIMAQIGGDANGDEAAGKETGADGSPAEEGDFTSELENVVQEADDGATETDSLEDKDIGGAAEAEITQEEGDKGPAASADTDQQEAFESIMAQIEGAQSEPKSSEEAQTSSADRPATEKEREKDASANVSAEGGTDGEAEDISSDIDDILKGVTVEEEYPESLESDAIEIASEQETSDRKTAEPGEEPLLQAEGDGAELVADDPQTLTPSAGTKSTAASLPAESETADRTDRKASTADKTQQAPLRETAQTLEKKWKRIAIGASAVALCAIVLVAYSYWSGRLAGEAQPTSATPQNEEQKTAVQSTQQAYSPTQAFTDASQDPTDQSRLKAIAASLDNLRGEMLAKQDEIEELRTYYKTGIDAEIEDIVRTVGSKNGVKITPATAMADPRIRLGVAAIQRRDTYIRKLAAPLETLLWNSEELLYFFRKAELLGFMTTKTSDIDVDGFIGQAEEIIDTHARTLAALNIDAVPAAPLPMETIWKNIVKQLPGKTVATESPTPATDNAAISESICKGDFARKHQLTELTAETARCLAKWKGKDLFLNAVKQLHPEAARQLAAWKGEWLGLNGLEELSPEAAAHLSRWPGKGLSMNGLTRLSPRVVAILAEWQGDQIELVNVKHMAHWENPNTRLFLSEELVRKRNPARN